MSLAPPMVDFQCKVNGQPVTLKIKTDLTYGEVQEILTRSVKVRENGEKEFLFNNFCDLLLTKTIVEGLPFPSTNLVKLKELPMSEVSVILGEIMKLIPLESYFKNIGMEDLNVQNQ